MARKRRWSELSPRTRRFIVVGGAVEAVLKLAALRDLRHRPAAQVRGSKRLWAAVIVASNSAGSVPLTYLLWGRHKPQGNA